MTPADLIEHRDPVVEKIMKRFVNEEIGFEEFKEEILDRIRDLGKEKEERENAWNRSMQGI